MQITEETIKKMKEYEATAKTALARARTGMLMTDRIELVFFASLGMRLKHVPNWYCPTCATDGKVMYYNPHFVSKLTTPELLGVILHELLHITNKFFARLGARDLKQFNIAHDLSINSILRSSKFTLPAGCLYPETYGFPDNLSAEEYYALLQRQKKGGGGGKGQPAKGQAGDGNDTIVLKQPHGMGGGQPQDMPDDPGGCGAAMPAGDKSDAAQKDMDAEWEVAVNTAANAAKARGKLPGYIDRLVEEASKPKVLWRELLRQFLTVFTKDDYVWSRPNRRYVAEDVYLPSMWTESLGEILCVIDTSGSIGPAQIKGFMAELFSIIELSPVRLTVAYHTTETYQVDRWTPEDPPYKINSLKSGGTSHEWVTDEWLRENECQPICMIFLTDLETAFGEDLGIPAFWAVIGNDRATPPWGVKVNVDLIEE